MTIHIPLKTGLSSKIANILRQEIYGKIIEIGEHLNETAIASKFGISRGPLRDAIRILENEGLVRTPSNGRTVVLGFSESEVIEYYELRYYLESQAIKKILSEPEDESYHAWLASLERLLVNVKTYKQYDDKDLIRKIDYEFHLSIQSRSNNRISIQIWKMLANMSMTIMEMNKKYMADQFFEYHDKYLISLRNRDLDMAIKTLKAHLQKGRETFLKVIRDI